MMPPHKWIEGGGQGEGAGRGRGATCAVRMPQAQHLFILKMELC